jgi:hypothetical protein
MKKFLKYNLSSQVGVAPIILLLFILAFLGLLLGIDYGYVYYLNRCGDSPINECLTDSTKKAEKLPESAEKKTLITAKGSFSYKKYSVEISMIVPLGGGIVNGRVDGDCSGTVSGTYSGGDNGAISGNIFGSCSPFFVPIPARATFSGTVNQQQKIVPITGSGGAAGFSGSGSITLTY